MTFTLRTLFAFINLRTDQHAQAEIFEYANKLSNTTELIYNNDLNIGMIDAAKKYCNPVYLKNNENNDSYYNEIDEEV